MCLYIVKLEGSCVEMFLHSYLGYENYQKYVKITLSYNKGICFMENGHLAKVDLTKN